MYIIGTVSYTHVTAFQGRARDNSIGVQKQTSFSENLQTLPSD